VIHRGVHLLACAAAAWAATTVSFPVAHAAAPGSSSYAIDVRLDPIAHTLSGRQRLHWRNTSDRPISELQFHLDFNAWRDPRSSWMRELRTLVGEVGFSEPERGALDIVGLRLLGPASRELTGTERFNAPDDGNADDRTVMTVPLPGAIAPGGELDVEVEWRAQVPRTIGGIGRVGDFYLLAHWYPQLCALQTSGWNCHQFRLSTRSSDDAASYDVRIGVPAGWVVGASGVESPPPASGDGATRRFTQEDIPDFAWTASPAFVVRHGRLAAPPLPEAKYYGPPDASVRQPKSPTFALPSWRAYILPHPS